MKNANIMPEKLRMSGGHLNRVYIWIDLECTANLILEILLRLRYLCISFYFLFGLFE